MKHSPPPQGATLEWPRSRSEQTLLAILALLVVAGFLFGGSATDRPVGFASVSILAAAALAAGLWRLGRTPGRHDVLALGLCAALVALPILQLTPLPSEIWSRLPGRDLAIASAKLVGAEGAVHGLTLAPAKTLEAVGWLLAPIAMFIGVMSIGHRSRRWLVGLYLAISMIGVVVGLYEMYLGPGYTLLPYEFVNAGLPTGFFANRNHQASSLAVALVLAAGAAHRTDGVRSRSGLSPRYIFLALAALFAAGILATLSRAGVILLALAVVAAAMLLARDPLRQRLGSGTTNWLLALAVALVALLALGLQPVLARFDSASTETRFEFWPPLAEAAASFWPLGSGLGTFRSVADAALPVELLTPSYVNEAHNEYLQLWLEAGVAFPLLFIGFIAWLVRQGLGSGREDGTGRDGLFWMSMVAIGLLLLHSFADYPLRTPAMAVSFGFLCGLLTKPPRRTSKRRRAA